MWLLDTHTFELQSFEGIYIPKYAILSHRWEEDEVLFADVVEGCYENRKGWTKIKSCCSQAITDGLSYVWVDTCCIDKKSSAELSEAINSMFKWYKEAVVCYAYLSDISDAQSLTSSQWFTRGWTLQELVAPQYLWFFDKDWLFIGFRTDHLPELCKKTGIPEYFLTESYSSLSCGIAQVMSWAAGRYTTREEDQAYSLMGLFGINMPLLYGEGRAAFPRLLKKIIKGPSDLSFLAWNNYRFFADDDLVLAPLLDNFRRCTDYDFRLGSGRGRGSWRERAGKRTVTNDEVTVAGSLIKGPSGFHKLLVASKDDGLQMVCIVLWSPPDPSPVSKPFLRVTLKNHFITLEGPEKWSDAAYDASIVISRSESYRMFTMTEECRRDIHKLADNVLLTFLGLKPSSGCTVLGPLDHVPYGASLGPCHRVPVPPMLERGVNATGNDTKSDPTTPLTGQSHIGVMLPPTAQVDPAFSHYPLRYGLDPFISR